MGTRKTKANSEFPVKLAAPARRALANAGIHKLEDLSRWSEKDVAQLHGIGANALNQLKQALSEASIKFRA